ncbi:Uma2 family endonuclease [Hydrogenivirga sp. 128-5-R1-1]|uniref:Uma2 family endonuclease n=1 Tax=Hydrogenivirga sp. 128-5-R1-1 TaxID=392423 RepID=UPI001E3F4F08|nr:Uma2 family endonuclease [Hydrogenivirga sp. 128-5-R1-1]
MAVKEKLSKEEKQELLKVLTYEKVKGKPIYYRGYKKVLKGELPPEAVMGSSGLQAFLIRLLVEFLLGALDRKMYEVLFNEIGFLCDKDSWRNLDIAVFEKEKVKPHLVQDKLIPIPPLVVIEVDTKADLSKYMNFEGYMYEKAEDLLNAGVQRVIWYITKVKKVLIAEPGKDWITADWDRDVEVLKGVELNLKKLLDKEGIEI